MSNTPSPSGYNALGEDRHMRCRYGQLTEAYVVHDSPGRPEHEEPITLPACTFPLPDRSPPALHRAWGGLVEYDRDCAVCKAYSPL